MASVKFAPFLRIIQPNLSPSYIPSDSLRQLYQHALLDHTATNASFGSRIILKDHSRRQTMANLEPGSGTPVTGLFLGSASRQYQYQRQRQTHIFHRYANSWYLLSTTAPTAFCPAFKPATPADSIQYLITCISSSGILSTLAYITARPGVNSTCHVQR